MDANYQYRLEWTGPVLLEWYKEHNHSIQKDDIWHADESAWINRWVPGNELRFGRIVRISQGSSDWVDVPPMQKAEWNELATFVGNLETHSAWSLNEICMTFELQRGSEISWARQ